MMCLDCPMHKYFSDWFGHVQVAPTVLTAELAMAYPEGCGGILELITGLTTSIAPGWLRCWCLWHLSAMPHCEHAGSATSSGVALLGQQN